MNVFSRKHCKEAISICNKPYYESEALDIFIMKISFYWYANKTNFHMKIEALHLAGFRNEVQKQLRNEST